MTKEELANEIKKRYSREYRQRNKEKLNMYYKEWRSNNKDKVKVYQEKYWLKKAEEYNNEKG